MNNEINKCNGNIINQSSNSKIINEKEKDNVPNYITNKKENKDFFDSSNSFKSDGNSKISQITLNDYNANNKIKTNLNIENKKKELNTELKNDNSYVNNFTDKLFSSEEHLNKVNAFYPKKSSSNQNLNYLYNTKRFNSENLSKNEYNKFYKKSLFHVARNAMKNEEIQSKNRKMMLSMMEKNIEISSSNLNIKKRKNKYKNFLKLELKEKRPKKPSIYSLIKSANSKKNNSPNNTNKNSFISYQNIDNTFNKCVILNMNENIISKEEKGKEEKKEIEEKKEKEENITTKKEINDNDKKENEINIYKRKKIKANENKNLGKINCFPFKFLCCFSYN